MSYQIIEADGSALQEACSIGSLTAKLLAASNFSSEQIADLLDGSDEVRPSRCEAVDRCCRRLMQAKANQEKVFVAGDYDADGICSTAIMKDLLDRLGISNGYYIPDRFKEGYGLSAATVELVHQKGYHLILTVDNGVKCQEAIAKAHELGMEIIITDHHEIEEEIPADLLVHPDVMEPDYAYLSGAGVVLQLSLNLLGRVDSHLALAAIALIGDVMPLWRQTRRIVKQGCSAIAHGALPSVLPLLRSKGEIDSTAVAFQIVPKLNSVGRMNDSSNVNTLVPFLLTTDPNYIASFAVQLNRVNDARRRCSDQTVKIAEQLNHDAAFPILFEESFEEGIVGLAAGKLSRQWHKPVLVFAQANEVYKGSGRSIPGLNLFEFFREFEEPSAFGGHAMAVGLTVPCDRFEAFVAHVETKMKTLPAIEEAGDPAVLISEADLRQDQIMELEGLRPYPREMVTLVAIRSPRIQSCQAYDRVTRYHFDSTCGGFDGVQFTSARSEPKESIDCLIGTPSLNRFRDRISAQVVIEAFSESGE
ncbi:MAG: DHH family phosphoesterase [Solobacterium sp.]|nr:DHH family phosphoesterase [Solobacterium sp.]